MTHTTPAVDEEQVPMVDIQNSRDDRNIPIDKVGVRNVKYPIDVRVREGGLQRTVGLFSLTVGLPHQFKGTHMSRFLEVLGMHSGDISSLTIPAILSELQSRLSAETAHLDVAFTYFREKLAPVTRKRGMMGYECRFTATAGAEDDFVVTAIVPVTTLCPCSKEISEFGAHNQRGYVKVRVRPKGLVWLEELIDLVERVASAPLYPVLKRPDEKFVTELAYLNPRFVEDMVREVAAGLDQRTDLLAYAIEVENHESIHDHNAYAGISRVLDGGKPLPIS
jgi:GTP cyclohydrolase I